MISARTLDVNPVSVATHQIRIYFQNQYLASATAFFYRYKDEIFLVTNWHNISGKNFETGENISNLACIPDAFDIPVRKNGLAIYQNYIYFELYKDENRELPEWLEHPTHGSAVDLVAIPFSHLIQEYGLDAHAINDDKTLVDVALKVSDDSFVVGFPFPDSTAHFFPIWKRATIATEPEINIRKLPLVYIDTATRKGFSGSPVMMRRIGLHFANGMPLTGLETIGEIRMFAGVYSGRVGDEKLGGQLGLMWKVEALLEILEARRPGESMFWPKAIPPQAPDDNS